MSSAVFGFRGRGAGCRGAGLLRLCGNLYFLYCVKGFPAGPVAHILKHPRGEASDSEDFIRGGLK